MFLPISEQNGASMGCNRRGSAIIDAAITLMSADAGTSQTAHHVIETFEGGRD